MEKLLITPDTKILEMVTAYPELEEKLIELAPVFVKLKNPILRKTVARISTLHQAAVVGGLSLGTLIAELRKVVNQDSTENFTEEKRNNSMPEWINTMIKKIEYDAIADIDNGVHPLARVLAETAELGDDEYYLLITNFTPKPLIDTLTNKGFEVYCGKYDSVRFGTYIRKKSS